MRHPLRAVSALTMTVVVYYGFVLACPERSHSLCLDFWNYFNEQKDMEESVRRSTELEKLNQLMVQRVLRKQGIAQAVIDERITLADASKQFLTLSLESPQSMTLIRSIYPAGSDEESCAMQILCYVHVCARTDPKKVAPEVVTRLEMELKMMRESCSKKLEL
jgi:hypothetical protein